ncbi:MAG: RIO1 family regulatory kinase/ATPase [Candidatus Parvarchaeota archaeon]
MENKIYLKVFDSKSLEALNKLEGDGYISNLTGPLSTGKESYVFKSRDSQNREVAVKIHRHDIKSFKKIPSYLVLRGSKSGGFLRRINLWTRYEFNFLSKAFNIGINVPEPYRVYENILVMQFLGEGDTPAKLAIKTTDFDKERWYGEIVDSIIKMGKAGFMHGDLSPYNIMNFNDRPYLIDFSQALKLSQATLEYLKRDIDNVNRWFAKMGLDDISDSENIIGRINKSYVKG